jgi:cytochrome c biogenesis protein CcmG, thiol:disulfide interchange protein DsbE
MTNGRHRNRRIPSALLTALVVVASAFPLWAGPDDATAAPTAPSPLAGLRLPDLQGKQVALESFLGKGPVVLDFWATWCKPCVAAMPELEALHQEFESRGVRVVGINADGARSAAKVAPFVKQHGIHFPVLLDAENTARTRLKAVALPTTLVFDARGTLVHTHFGYMAGQADLLRKQVETLLASPAE